MKILEDKGYLKKALVDRAHVYRPAQKRQPVVRAMVRDVLDRVFDSAPGDLLMHLAKDNKLTDKQRRIVLSSGAHLLTSQSLHGGNALTENPAVFQK